MVTYTENMATSFKEVQRFNQPWLWSLLLLMLIVEVGVFGYGFLQQLVWGEPWGDRPMSDEMLLLTGGGAILFSVVLVYLFYILRLVTEVRYDGLLIRFYPLRGKFIPYRSIESCRARSYQPIKEYGGWGIKYGLSSGWAYNISGDRGVQLVLKDGKKILVGSQQPEALEQAIKQHC
jgi:hypothetical protein